MNIEEVAETNPDAVVKHPVDFAEGISNAPSFLCRFDVPAQTLLLVS
jgi:succinyl-CoA synthetase beta subunit